MADCYTREEIVKSDFLFVSYQHNDKAIVSDTIDTLISEGVRLWYDADLGYGDRWIDIAEGLIKHENCRGVIFFNSLDAFLSEPVYKERCAVLEKIRVCRQKNVPFCVFPVNIGVPSTMRLLKKVFEALPDNDKQIEKSFPLKYIETISALFDSETIYCYADPQDPAGYRQSLLETVSKVLPCVIDKGALRMREMEGKQAGAIFSVKLGVCKNEPVSTIPSYLLQKNQTIVFQNNTYIVQDAQAYTINDISWRPLYCENDVFALIAETFVDVRNGGKELTEWLKTEFVSTAFSDKERACVQEIRLLAKQDVEKVINRELLVFADCAESWWINDMAHGALQMVIKKDGSVFTAGYNYRTKRFGIRPVIFVHKEALDTFSEK